MPYREKKEAAGVLLSDYFYYKYTVLKWNGTWQEQQLKTELEWVLNACSRQVTQIPIIHLGHSEGVQERVVVLVVRGGARGRMHTRTHTQTHTHTHSGKRCHREHFPHNPLCCRTFQFVSVTSESLMLRLKHIPQTLDWTKKEVDQKPLPFKTLQI